MTTNYFSTLRLFSRDIRLFYASAAVVGFAWDGIRAVLFNLYMLRLGYGPEYIGLVNGVGAAAFAVSCLFAGVMGTRWGSRRTAIAGMVVLAAGFGLVPFAESLPVAWTSGWLVATNVLTHIGFALYLVNGLPFMMGASGHEERNHVFSFHIALVPVAGFIGSLLAGVLPGLIISLGNLPPDATAAHRLPLWLGALSLVPGILALLPTSRSLDEPPQDDAPEKDGQGKSTAPIALFVIIAVVAALRFAGRGTVITFANVYLDDALGVSTALIGALTAASQLLAIPVALGTPLLVARHGNPRTVFGGTFGMALAILPMALVPHWWAAGVGLVGSSMLFTLSIGPLRVFSQELVRPRWRATMASSFMGGAGVAFSTVSIAGGFAIAAVGYRTVFLAAAALAVIGAVLFWLYFRPPREELAWG